MFRSCLWASLEYLVNHRMLNMVYLWYDSGRLLCDLGMLRNSSHSVVTTDVTFFGLNMFSKSTIIATISIILAFFEWSGSEARGI